MERYNSNKVCRDKRQAAVTKYIASFAIAQCSEDQEKCYQCQNIDGRFFLNFVVFAQYMPSINRSKLGMLENAIPWIWNCIQYVAS